LCLARVLMRSRVIAGRIYCGRRLDHSQRHHRPSGEVSEVAKLIHTTHTTTKLQRGGPMAPYLYSERPRVTAGKAPSVTLAAYFAML
jgi:hypothetical protein